ncbi:MAG: c-type cytochrome biogenesis protein CcmI [Rhodospirillaceae bacterium]|nr:c-type cytochrome biogenesis protein CcmI [Rhodospirillaceae bacterium]
MELWIVISAMCIVATGAIILGVGRARGGKNAVRADYDLSVYKDQLGELDRDLERGVLNETETSAARTEIERRILTLGDQAAAANTFAARTQTSRLATVLIGVGVSGAALALYLHLGSPHLPNVPYTARNIESEKSAETDRRQAGEMSNLADKLAARLKAEPDNIRGWMLLGRSYLSLNREADALVALKTAYELDPLNAAVIIEYAEALILTDKNRVGEKATSLLERALGADPRNPRARYYLAQGLAQKGNLKGALQGWIDLVAVSPDTAPWLASVGAQITAIAKDLNVDPGTYRPSPAAQTLGKPKPMAPAIAGAPGPSQEDVEAAFQMSAQDRTEMIRSMVQRLADRLKENPDDLAGWRRLLQAYRVLGDDAKAAGVEARIKSMTQ